MQSHRPTLRRPPLLFLPSPSGSPLGPLVLVLAVILVPFHGDAFSRHPNYGRRKRSFYISGLSFFVGLFGLCSLEVNVSSTAVRRRSRQNLDITETIVFQQQFSNSRFTLKGQTVSSNNRLRDKYLMWTRLSRETEKERAI